MSKFQVGDKVKVIGGFDGNRIVSVNEPQLGEVLTVKKVINSVSRNDRPSYTFTDSGAVWDESRFALVDDDTITTTWANILAAYAAATSPDAKKVLRKLYPGVMPKVTRQVPKRISARDMRTGHVVRLHAPTNEPAEVFVTAYGGAQKFVRFLRNRGLKGDIYPLRNHDGYLCHADGTILYDTIETEGE